MHLDCDRVEFYLGAKKSKSKSKFNIYVSVLINNYVLMG